MIMDTALKILPHYTYDDYIHWEGQWEIIDGIPYAMSPSPVPKHQRIANAVSSEFHFALKKCKSCHVYQPLDYKVKDDVILQPDMLVICQPIQKKYLDFAPNRVVEILSPATAEKDRLVKFPIYESQQIPYYLIIDPDKEEIEIYEYKNKYQLQQQAKHLTYTFLFENGSETSINFTEIW